MVQAWEYREGNAPFAAQFAWPLNVQAWKAPNHSEDKACSVDKLVCETVHQGRHVDVCIII